MNTPILQMRGITKTFPGVKALQDVTLDVNRGEVHAICGENGAGKSTLMKVLSGVYPHNSFDGDILFENEPCNFSSISDSEKRGIVIIHQELALSPYLSIAENIYLGNEQAKRGWVDWRKTNLEAAQTAGPGGPERKPGHPRPAHQRRQAAARGNRQGALEGGQAPDPGRADGGAQRRGLRATCWT